MPLKLVNRLSTFNQSIEQLLGTDNEAYTAGEALVLTSGRLTKCGATATPEFVSVKAQAAESTAVTPIAVLRVQEDMVFSTTSTATVAATLVGAKVTLHTTGGEVTATTSSGVATIVATDGKTTNSNVQVSFRR